MFDYKPDYKFYYIDHYQFKSTEEFAKKINKSDAFYLKDIRMEKINVYFQYNEITIEKLKYLENFTRLNLSKFRDQIKKNN